MGFGLFSGAKTTSFRGFSRKFTGSDFSPCHGATPSARSSVCRTSRATFPWVGLVGIFAACQLCLANKMRRIWKKWSREKSVVWWFLLKRNLALRWHSLYFRVVSLKWHGWILTEDTVSAPCRFSYAVPSVASSFCSWISCQGLTLSFTGVQAVSFRESHQPKWSASFRPFWRLAKILKVFFGVYCHSHIVYTKTRMAAVARGA